MNTVWLEKPFSLLRIYLEPVDGSSPIRVSFRALDRSSIEVEQSVRGIAQPGSASALGAEGRGFKSLCPDQHLQYSVSLSCII